MKTKYILMAGEEMPFIAESEDFKKDGVGRRWIYWYYQSGAYLFDSKEDAHTVAKEIGLSSYTLLESYASA